jgi:exodeoxyribonuclease V alpha subunit
MARKIETLETRVTHIIFEKGEFMIAVAEDPKKRERLFTKKSIFEDFSLVSDKDSYTISFNKSGLKVNEDDILKLTGYWTKYKDKPQFRGETSQLVTKITPDGFYKWLSRGSVEGVGKKTLDLLKVIFDNNILNVLTDQNNIDLFVEAGLTREKAEKIIISWENRDNISVVQAELLSLGLKQNQVDFIIKKFGVINSLEKVKNDPWSLLFENGFGFATIDSISKKFDISPTDPKRLFAGLSYMLKESAIRHGHCCLLESDLIQKSSVLLSVSKDEIKNRLDEILKTQIFFYKNNDKIYLLENYLFEKNIVTGLSKLLDSDPIFNEYDVELAILESEKILGLNLDRDGGQFKAAILALMSPVSIITGGPGTGKTTTQKIIVKALEILGENENVIQKIKNNNNFKDVDQYEVQHKETISSRAYSDISENKKYEKNRDFKISLCAPTGRAAKRLSEATGKSVKTIHMLLGYSVKGVGSIDQDGKQISDQNEKEFKKHCYYNNENKLVSSVVIVDEFSMVDLNLASSLIEAISNGTKLIIIGDKNQLPSVGPGQILYDLIHSSVIPVAELTKVHRQSEGSGISIIADRLIKKQNVFLPDDNFNDFIVIEKNDEDIIPSLLKYIREDLIEKGIDPLRDIQILCCMKKGSSDESEDFSLGTKDLNYILKMALNPPLKDGKTVQVMKEFYTIGDKVMQTKNNYDLGVFNGEIGTVLEVNENDRSLKVDYGNATLSYIEDDVNNNLDFCFSGTIHKSQGGEAPIILMINPEAHSFFMNKNLLYTGLSRARNLCVIFGKKSSFIKASKKEDLSKRQTGLLELLTEKIKKNDVLKKDFKI